MGKERNNDQRLVDRIIQAIEKGFATHKTKSPGVVSYIMTFVSGIAGVVLTLIFSPSISEKVSQEIITRERITARHQMTELLSKGRSPKGSYHPEDYLPVHENFETFKNWWNRIDEFYDQNADNLAADSAIRPIYKRLNEAVLAEAPILKVDSTIGTKHRFKDTIAKRCDSIIDYFIQHPIK